ncbi:hypothetical protein FALCPG4_005045 [Fusarium falciforme]
MLYVMPQGCTSAATGGSFRISGEADKSPCIPHRSEMEAQDDEKILPTRTHEPEIGSWDEKAPASMDTQRCFVVLSSLTRLRPLLSFLLQSSSIISSISF